MISNAVLLPVVMRSPVVPLPSWPFSPEPKAYTVHQVEPPYQRRQISTTYPFPLSVRTQENVTPADALTAFSWPSSVPKNGIRLKYDTSGLGEWPHCEMIGEEQRAKGAAEPRGKERVKVVVSATHGPAQQNVPALTYSYLPSRQYRHWRRARYGSSHRQHAPTCRRRPSPLP